MSNSFFSFALVDMMILSDSSQNFFVTDCLSMESSTLFSNTTIITHRFSFFPSSEVSKYRFRKETRSTQDITSCSFNCKWMKSFLVESKRHFSPSSMSACHEQLCLILVDFCLDSRTPPVLSKLTSTHLTLSVSIATASANQRMSIRVPWILMRPL